MIMKMKPLRRTLIQIAAGLLLSTTLAKSSRTEIPSLKEIFKNDFMIGAALNRRQFSEEDARAAPIIRAHFNSITPENQLKWMYVHPAPDKYDFTGSDQYVAFGEKYGMYIVGHTLVWHRQTPDWVFEDGSGKPVSREILLNRLRDHIHRVVGRYKGRIKGWDVVNEAIDANGTMRQSKWMKIIGEDYVAKAFEFAHEADPDAQLYYNDYSLENEPKRTGAIQLIKKLQAEGIAVAAIGLQGHNKLDWPTVEQQDATIAAFAKLGIKVNITELDIDVLPAIDEEAGLRLKLTPELQAKLNPFASSLPEAISKEQSRRYGELFGVYVKYRDVIDRITFWGVTDGDTWLNNWPVRGRTNYPLLFDRQGKPKLAFDAVVNAGLNAKH
jgi:endo-1,4-beta-xylanase